MKKKIKSSTLGPESFQLSQYQDLRTRNIEATHLKDSMKFLVDISLNPRKTFSEEFTKTILRDVSDRKEIEKKRADLLLHEQEANRAKDEFFSMLSHELRTPISIILNWIQLLRSGKLNVEQNKHAIDVLEKCAKTQAQLIDDLLDVTRIAAGKLQLTIQNIDPRKVIADVIELSRNFAKSKSIQIKIEINPSIKTICADPARLQQIILNLITNAIKFTPEHGKIWINVNLVMTPLGRRISIQVRDNGKGIKPEFIPIIFERFTQAESSNIRSYGGLGLGLSIVRKLVELHGGSVSAESPGELKGSTFTVFLPLETTKKANTALNEIKTEVETLTCTETNNKENAKFDKDVDLEGLRVLFVDDDADIREIFSIMLQNFGAEVKMTKSASEALNILEQFKPDVLISDISMPLEDGYSLITNVRALRSKLKQIPAIALTAHTCQEEIQRIYLAGFQSYIAKPVDPQELALTISKLVEPNEKLTQCAHSPSHT